MADFLIYGQLIPNPDHDNTMPSSSGSPPTTLHMFASRILQGPPQPVARPPRPDDPTPRKPPASAASNGAKRKRDGSIPSLVLVGASKRSKASPEEDEQIRRAREVMLNMPKAGPSQPNGLKRARSSKASDASAFKVPSLPARGGSLGTIPSQSSSDVFGIVSETGKGKGKEAAEQTGSSELEKANKTVSAPFGSSVGAYSSCA